MNRRLQRVGIGLVLMGIAFFAAGGYTLYRTQQGAGALQAFSAAQNVKLTYNEQGQLVDRGETADADKIMSLLVNDWGYAVDKSELNPNDPLVNTASEYMYQMATISYHTLHATTTVTIPADVVVDGQVVTKAGDYEFVNDGRYWTGFDRTDPIEAAAREQIWTGTAHALIAELGVGSVTASALTMGLGIAALFGLVGLTIVLFGLGLVWATRAETEKVKAPVLQAGAHRRLTSLWRLTGPPTNETAMAKASPFRGSSARGPPSRSSPLISSPAPEPEPRADEHRSTTS